MNFKVFLESLLSRLRVASTHVSLFSALDDFVDCDVAPVDEIGVVPLLERLSIGGRRLKLWSTADIGVIGVLVGPLDFSF